MTARTRLWVLVVSTPIIAFTLIGGYLGEAMVRDDTVRHIRIFDDVLQLVLDNYVEEVDESKAMKGALRGLTDGLDPDSAYLSPELATAYESGEAPAAGEIGVDLIRQYYLRVVSVRDGSPAAKAGLRTDDYIRAIDGRATRDMSAFEGMRLLRGAPGSTVDLLVIRGNAAEPHEVTLTRERLTAPEVTTRMANASTGYVRIAEFTENTPARVEEAVRALAKTGARGYVVDLRGTSRGDLDHGIAAARLFVASGTLAVRESKAGEEKIEADAETAAITAPVVLLVDHGTAGAAEIFAAALEEDDRAELVGEQTTGRAARQQLVKLPDGSALLLSSMRYLTPDDEPIHGTGLTPDVQVERPEVEFGADPPPGDAALDAAIEELADDLETAA